MRRRSWWAAFACACAAAALSPAAARAESPPTVAIVHATALLPGATRIEDATVVMTGERVVAVGTGLAAPAGATVVGIAGTVTTIAAVARDVDPYDGARVHGMRLGADEVAACAARAPRCFT